MTGVARALDVLAVALGALAVVVLGGGGFEFGRLSVTRVEDVAVALALVVGVRAALRRYRLPHVHPERAAVVGAVLYAVLMSFIVLTRHRAIRTHALDLGYYVQVVWNMAAGHGAYVTLPPMHAWGDHFSPILYAFAPLAWLVPGAAPLLVGQSVVIAAGALAVFRFAWGRVGHGGLAAALALLYLANPSIHGTNLRDVHPQAFAIALVPAAALAFDRGRYGWCAVALLATLAGREDAAVAGVGFGLWMAFARGRWVAGALVAAASVGVLAVDIGLVMPYFRGAPYPHLHRHAYLGTSLGDILVTLVARPWRWLPVVLSPAKLVYLAALLAPLGFLPLLAPRALVAVLPGLSVNLLALDPALFSYRSQYISFVLPFLVLAAVDGARRLRAVCRVRWHAVTPARAVALGLVVSAVLTARTLNDLMVTRWILDPAQQAAHAIVAQVPAGASASVNERLVPHLATRREIYVFPTGVPKSEYVAELERVAGQVPPGYVMVARDTPWALWRNMGAATGPPSPPTLGPPRRSRGGPRHLARIRCRDSAVRRRARRGRRGARGTIRTCWRSTHGTSRRRSARG